MMTKYQFYIYLFHVPVCSQMQIGDEDLRIVKNKRLKTEKKKNASVFFVKSEMR